jgi:hypothetical protein
MANVTINQSARSLFYIFSVTATGAGYNAIFRTANFTGSNQSAFNAWNRIPDGDTIQFFRADGTAGLTLGNQAPYTGTLPYDGTPFFFSIVNGTASVYVSANGTSLTPSPISGVGGTTYATYNTNADTFTVGTGGYDATVLIGEVIEYSGDIGLSNVYKVEGYLAWKWGKQASLPVTHPYKNAPPGGVFTNQINLVNTSLNPGTIQLQSTFMTPGYVTTFKDQTGAFSTNALTLTTNNTNQKIDNIYFRTINQTGFGWQNFIAGNNSNWYTVGGTVINTVNTSTMNALSLSTPTISSANIIVSTMTFRDQTFGSNNSLSVQSSLMYYNYAGVSTILAGTRQAFGLVTLRMAGIFNPRQITNLNFWLDAADITTQTITRGYVTQWRDKSANAYTFSNTALTGRTGPTRVLTLNGLNVLSFTSVSADDANGQFLANAAAAINENLQTIFIVNNPVSVTGGPGTYWGNTSIIRLQPGGYIVFPYAGAGGTALGYISDLYGSGLPDNSVANTYNLIVANIANGAQSVWRNGTRQAATTKAIGSSLLTGTFIASWAGTFEFYSGTIAEIIVYNAALTTIQQQQVEGYLAWKWGLVGNLPASHLYKNNPP